MATVLYEKKGEIAKIRLNRPDALNAVNDELSDELDKAMRRAIADAEVKVIILCGNGKAFCAGFDLKQGDEHVKWIDEGKMTMWDVAEKGTAQIQELTRLQRYPIKVVIGAVHGWAVGLGFEIVIACDLVVAAEDTKFGFPELDAGWTITSAATKLLPAIVGLNRAKKWMFAGSGDGNWVSVDEAYHSGLVDKVVPLGQEEKVAEELAKTIMSKKWPVVLQHKRLLNASLDCDLESMLWFEMAGLVASGASGAAGTGIKEFIERKKR
jgi:enoyl-CoA hydratase/carnithine racemase